MVKINLRDYYPFYQYNYVVEVPDKVAEEMQRFDRLEATYQRKRYRNKAHYSLDRNDGIENEILIATLSPSEIYECKVTCQQIYAAVASLPEKQGKRIYAHYILGMSKAEIARAESVGENSVNESIKRGLRNMKIFLKKQF